MENPEILWAQTRDRVFITIKIIDLKEQEIEILDNIIIFKGKNNESDFNLKLRLFKTIITTESNWSIKVNGVEFNLRKDGDFFWGKLLTEKYNNLRIDWSRWQDDDDSDDEVNQNRKMMLDNFSEFTKTLPKDLMEKDFTELFNEDLDEEIKEEDLPKNNKIHDEEYDAGPSSEDGFIDNIDVRNIGQEMMSKMEEGRITREDRESLSSPESSCSSPEEENRVEEDV